MNIICVPPKSLTSAQKSTLTKKGCIIIETNEPEKIRVISAETTVDTNDFFMSALFALTSRTPVNEQEQFVNELYSRLKESEQMPKEQKCKSE